MRASSRKRSRPQMKSSASCGRARHDHRAVFAQRQRRRQIFLHRDFAAERGVAGVVGDAETALAEDRNQLVVPQPRSRRKRAAKFTWFGVCLGIGHHTLRSASRFAAGDLPYVAISQGVKIWASDRDRPQPNLGTDTHGGITCIRPSFARSAPAHCDMTHTRSRSASRPVALWPHCHCARNPRQETRAKSARTV